MSDLMKLIQDADMAAVDLEKARTQVEVAKQNLESAKDSHDQARSFLDEILAQADEIGVPRAKIKKLIEERTQALMASGLIPTAIESRPPIPKTPRAPKKSKMAVAENEMEHAVESEKDEAFPLRFTDEPQSLVN